MKAKRKLFLVVEDFEDSRFMMRRLLEMAGYQVLEASDGEQAIRIAVEHHPTVILMDLSLPKLDGLSATREIRKKKGLQKVPIVAVSAHDSPQTRIEALAAGCNEYITKPIDFDNLNAVLARYLAEGSSHKTIASSPSRRRS
ncbi:MAG TPA: response regulator [Pyrinomonadaceae bacterium]|nr:response regulator [Pyrinomonadaceae bacterium]